MGGKQRFDKRKCLEAVVYVASRVPDKHGIMKALYQADRCHLENYGRLIYSDTYRAAQYGPVASNALSMVDAAADGAADHASALSVSGHEVIAERGPDLRFLSPSEVECLDCGIEMVHDKSFNERTKMCHDAAWDEGRQRTDLCMSIESIISTLPNAEEVLDYVYNG